MALSESTQSSKDVQADLIEKNLDFARNVAAKAAQKLPIEVADAIQVGYQGLVQAAQRFDIEKYDPTQGTLDNHFKSFAYPRIAGSVYDFARRDNFVRRRGLEKGIEVKFESLDTFSEIEGQLVMHPDLQLEAIDSDVDLKMDFEAALKHLTERERFVVMALAAGMKGHEVGDSLGVSESRISQIAKDARTKLKDALEGYDL